MTTQRQVELARYARNKARKDRKANAKLARVLKLKYDGWWCLGCQTTDGELDWLWFKSEMNAHRVISSLGLKHITVTDDEGYETTIDGFFPTTLVPAWKVTLEEWCVMQLQESGRRCWIQVVAERPKNLREGTSKQHGLRRRHAGR